MTDTPDTPSTVPVLPYSYFKADGASLDAVETMQSAKKEHEKMRKDLCKRFGADDMMGGYDAVEGRYRFHTFYFSPANEDKVPADWDVTTRQTGSNGELQAIFAKPAAGSKDDFFVTDYCGLMLRAAKRSRIENVFGCGDMPMKELPAGDYHGAFVRNSNVNKDKYNYNQDGIGQIKDNVTMCFGSNSACKGSDPIDMMKMMDDWYIRVPNDETGKPHFMPPDALEVSLKDMLALDKQERGQRAAAAQMRSFNPHI